MTSAPNSFAQGPFSVDYESRYDPNALRRKRLARAQEQLARSECDALLVWKDENVRYTTALRPQIIAGKSTLLNGALILPDEPPVLFCSGGERDRVARTMPWIAEAHVVPIMEQRDLVDGAVRDIIGPVLSSRGLDTGSLGIDECGTVLRESVARHLPRMTVADGDTPMQLARRHKLPAEINLLEEASALADAVTAAGVASVQDGVREWDVTADAMHRLFSLGGEYAHVMTPFVASGEHMSPPNRISSDKLIRNGDLVFIDIGASWNGYFGDVARTTICGKPSHEQREIYTAVHEALHAGIEQMRPGRTNVQASQAIIAAADRHGLADRFLSLFIGHGVGIGGNEPPYVGETLPGAPEYEFEPGMVFALEPLIWVEGIRGGGGVRLEEMVLITDSVPHVLSRAPFDDRLLL